MSEMLLFQDESGKTNVNVRLDGDTFWLTQDQMADLFGRDRTVITKHLASIYEDEELTEAATCAKFALVRNEGSRSVSRDVAHYNLDAMPSNGRRRRRPKTRAPRR